MVWFVLYKNINLEMASSTMAEVHEDLFLLLVTRDVICRVETQKGILFFVIRNKFRLIYGGFIVANKVGLKGQFELVVTMSYFTDFAQ